MTLTESVTRASHLLTVPTSLLGCSGCFAYSSRCVTLDDNGSGTSRFALKCPILVICSFSTRKKFQIKRRNISTKAMKKNASELYCFCPGAMRYMIHEKRKIG